jgi:hypothetical protein
MDFTADFSSPVLDVRGYSTKPLEDPHPRIYPPKYRMLVVQERCRREGEEELRTCGSLANETHQDTGNDRTVAVGTRVSHCQDPRTGEP